MMLKSLSDFFNGTFEWKNLRVKWHDPTKTLIFNSNWSIPFHPETCGLNVKRCNCELRQAAKAMDGVKNLKPRFVIYLVMNPIRFIRIQERSNKNNESQKSIVSENYRTIEKFTQKKCLTISLHLMFIFQDTQKKTSLPSPSTDWVPVYLGSPSNRVRLGIWNPLPHGFLRLQHGPWWMGFSFFCGLFETCKMALSFRMCGRSNFGWSSVKKGLTNLNHVIKSF